MANALVTGASGYIGGRLVRELYALGEPVGCVVRDPSRVSPECEWRMGWMGAAFGTESFRGQDGLRAWVSAFDEGFESRAWEIDEVKITGEGVVLLRGRFSGRSRGIHMELPPAPFWQEIAFRDRLLMSVVQIDAPPPGWDEATPIT